MNLQTIPYHSYEKGLPQEGNVILGQVFSDSIYVYQAFNDKIADYALQHQKFGGQNYNFDRMTWIKPNFLWMMYRSGWAQKDANQNRILAIEMTIEGFEELLNEGVLTSYNKFLGDEKVWRDALNKSDVRIQWDPDHDYKGKKLMRRAVQIGVKNNALLKFNNEYIKSIQDITDFVNEQKARIDNNEECFFVVNEKIVEISNTLKAKFSIPEKFISPFVEAIISEFNNSHSVNNEDFEKLLIDNDELERIEFVNYIKNNQHPEFSRYLLRKAIAYRKREIGNCGCMCEDLLMFSYFVSKNGETKDFDLVMEAKLTDFDTWIGFDGEMIFYTLGFQDTKDYISANKDNLINKIKGFNTKTADYFIESFDEDYLYNDINSRAFWYL